VAPNVREARRVRIADDWLYAIRVDVSGESAVLWWAVLNDEASEGIYGGAVYTNDHKTGLFSLVGDSATAFSPAERELFELMNTPAAQALLAEVSN
jgi:hypothetical protein